MRRQAYIVNQDRTVLIDFQFSPHILPRTEGSNISVYTQVGKVEPDLYWVNTRPENLSIPFFIDRSKESLVGSQTTTLYEDPRKFPRLDKTIDGLVSSSAIANGLRRAVMSRKNSDIPFELSSYDPVPHFKQNKESVISDISLFKAFIKPKGFKQEPSSMIVKSREYRGKIIKDAGTFERFVPPELVTLFYGGLWVEGYLADISYEYSLFNNEKSKPERVTGTLNIQVLRDGTFEFEAPGYDVTLNSNF